ncbi:ectodysplasin-A-like isoform X3 [Gigantopelta aegis]|uniref:ectodysplasin-A-like isoform X3 n=1 Tax=Gigantopelta aegis TaxID=1735272 RepID=UPI001B888DD1|nr:ectodysplasin-A-like isoform X3 [Gigantopelta aegis]
MSQQGFLSSTPDVIRPSSELDTPGSWVSPSASKDQMLDIRTCGCTVEKSKHVVRLPVFVVCQVATVAVVLVLAVSLYLSVEENKRHINEVNEIVYKHCIVKETHEVSTVVHQKTLQFSTHHERVRRDTGTAKTTEEGKPRKHHRRKNRVKGRSCKGCKRGKRGKQGRQGPQGIQGERGPPGPTGPQGLPGEAASAPTIRAAHYTADLWRDKTEEEFGEGMEIEGVKCKYFKEWDGKACRNQTNFRFMKEADWVKNNRNIYSPADFYENGTYVIKESGLYLVYTSILYYDAKMKQSQTVVRNGKKLFKCMDGVDHISETGNRYFNAKYKTCSITGVAFLHKNDEIQVRNLYTNTVIDISPDSTFFGLVQLIPGPDHVQSNT